MKIRDLENIFFFFAQCSGAIKVAKPVFKHLSGGLLEVLDEVLALLLLLDAGEDHLGTRDVLLGGKEVVEEGLVVPVKIKRVLEKTPLVMIVVGI